MRSIRARVLSGAAVALATSLALAATAAASGLQVSPAIVDHAAKRSGEMLPPITVVNPTKEEMLVTVSFGTVAHDAMGGPLLDVKGYKFAAPQAFKVKEPKFKLAPGATKKVEVQVNFPKGRTAGGLYGAMYLLATPTKQKETTLKINVRMAVVLEVALPGAAKRAVAPVATFARQDGAGMPVTVFAQVRNDGEIHEKVQGLAVITNAKNVQVAKVPLVEVNVFPGLVRGLQGQWKAPANLPAGTYRINSEVKGPNANMKITGELKVVKPGEVASERVIVAKFLPAPAVQKKPLPLEAGITNTGNVPFAPKGYVQVNDDKGAEVARIALAGDAKLAAGGKGTLKGTLATGLPAGRYQGRLVVTGGFELVLAQRDFPLQILEKDPNVSAKIVKFDPPKGDKPFYTLEVLNDGNADLDTEGVVMIADSSGNIVGQVVLDKRPLAPGKATQYLQALPELESGLYELRAFVKFGGKAAAQQTIKHFVQ